jgi:DNA-binding transcriptional LysR family regulator
VDELHQRLTGSLAVAIFDKTASNPRCHISRAFARFDEQAPDVHPEVHVQPINAIEAGVIDGRFQLGIIPTHRHSNSLNYHHLFDEQMYLYCGALHPLYAPGGNAIDLESVRAHRYVGMGYHSPNMEITRELGLQRHATAHDQEAVAHLVLSGKYLGFLPEHYAESFVTRGLMRPLLPTTVQYVCEFSAIVRHSPPPNRVVQTLLDALVLVHS